MTKKTVGHIFLGPGLFAVTLCFVPEALMPYSMRGAVGLFLWMAAWWITIPVGVAVTSLLPLLLCALFGFVKVGTLLPLYFSDLVVLLLGANLLTVTWETTGLSRRIALRVLSLVGPSMKSQIATWFLASIAMSIFLPNMLVAATLTPIAMAMLQSVGKQDPSIDSSAANILLAIAWGAGLGGFGSPLGGGMNLVVIGYMEQVLGKEYMYISWVQVMLPMLLVIALGTTLYFIRIPSQETTLAGAKEHFVSQYSSLGKRSWEETISFWFFVVPVGMAFTRPWWAKMLPDMSASFTFLLFAVVAFCLPGSCSGRMITWKYAQSKVSWGLLYTVSGGLALGKVVVDSGASEALATIIPRFGVTNAAVLMLSFMLLASVLANISSNNSACAITAPLVVSVMSALQQNPVPYLYMAAIGGNIAYLLPGSTRAIPVDAGVDPSYMFKKGAMLNVISLLLAMACALVYLRMQGS